MADPMITSPLSVRILKLIANYTSNWCGEALDTHGLIRISNPNGARDPLIWVFNDQSEHDRLASVLDPEQPMIGLRSLNKVIDREQLGATINEAIAQHYVDLLNPVLFGRRFYIGGNCQGGLLANRLAMLLLRQGHLVEGFIALEIDQLLPLPTQALLMFGAESHKFNPFLKAEDPLPRWSHQFQATRHTILPGGHGTYFSDTTLPILASSIGTVLSARQLKKSAEHEMGFLHLRRNIVETAEFEFEADIPLPKGCKAFLHWSHKDTPHFLQRIVDLDQPSNQSHINLHAPCPKVPGLWQCEVFLTLPEQGPIAWSESIEVLGKV